MSANIEDIKNQVIDHTSLHKYRTEIPNIITDLLRLNVYQKAVYFEYKRMAGDAGSCYKSNKKIAYDLDISVRKLQYTKQELAEPWNQLNGKPLIKITERKTEKGDRDTDLVEIIDIWEENFLYYYQKKYKGAAQHTQGVLHDVQEGIAPGAHKEELFKEDLFKELTNQQTPPKAQKVSKSSESDSGLVSFSEKQKTIENLKLSESQLSESQKRTILKHCKSMELDFFKSQVAKFADYAKSNHVTNHFGLLRSVLGLDEKPAWEDAKPKDQGSIEEQNREAAKEKLGAYDGKPIKGLSFEILNTHCQFTSGTFAQIFEFKNYDFVPRMNEFLERLGLDVCFG